MIRSFKDNTEVLTTICLLTKEIRTALSNLQLTVDNDVVKELDDTLDKLNFLITELKDSKDANKASIYSNTMLKSYLKVIQNVYDTNKEVRKTLVESKEKTKELEYWLKLKLPFIAATIMSIGCIFGYYFTAHEIHDKYKPIFNEIVKANDSNSRDLENLLRKINKLEQSLHN